MLERAGFAPASHDGKALLHILETYPRDELFQIADDELFDIALGILHLQERQRVALFVRRDPFERFVSCLVYVPRDRYDTELRAAHPGHRGARLRRRASTAFYTQMTDVGAGARSSSSSRPRRGAIPEVDAAALEATLVEAGAHLGATSCRTRWSTRTARSRARAAAPLRRGLPGRLSRAVRRPHAAVADIERIEEALAGRTARA